MTQESALFLQCPHCHKYDRTKVVDSRRQHASNRIRRRRECAACGGRFTTYESIEVADLVLIKQRKKTISQVKSLLSRLE